MLAFLYRGLTTADLTDSENILCSKEKLAIIRFKRHDRRFVTSCVSLKDKPYFQVDCMETNEAEKL